MSVLDHAALAGAALHADPYAFAVVPESIADRDTAALLRKEFVRANFVRNERAQAGASKKYLMYNYEVVTENVVDESQFDGLAPVWQELVREILSTRYRDTVQQLAGIPLDDAGVTVRIDRYLPGCWIEPHVDRADKVVTHLLYFNEEWRPEWGGEFRVLNGPDMDDCRERVLPLLGTSVVMVRSDRSWHGVPPVAPEAPEGRMSMLVHFVQR